MPTNEVNNTSISKRSVRPGEGRRAGNVRRSTKQMRVSQDWLDHFNQMSLRTGKSPGECAEEVAQVNRLHVHAVAQRFLNESNKENNTNYVVHDTSEPFIVLAKDGDKSVWIEVTDVFLTSAHEKLLYSLAVGADVEQTSGVHINPDASFTDRVIDTFAQRMRDPSYQSFYDEHGPGILLIGLHDPLFSKSTMSAIKSRRDELQKTAFWTRSTGFLGQVWLDEDGKFERFQ